MSRFVRSSGAALLLAMGLVATISAVAVRFMSGSDLATRQIIGQHWQTQGRWLLDGGIEWVKLILAEDARGRDGRVDHLGEPWAIPIRDIDLSNFLMQQKGVDWVSGRLDDVRFSGRIVDAQASLNLTVENDSDERFVRTALERLTLKRGGAVADYSIVRADRQDGAGVLAGFETMGFISFGLLAGRTMDDPRSVVNLPEPTPVNLNTANQDVLFAVIQNSTTSEIAAIINARGDRPFDDFDDFLTRFPSFRGRTSSRWLAAKTSFFLVLGELRFGNLTTRSNYLVKRQAQDIKVLQARRHME